MVRRWFEARGGTLSRKVFILRCSCTQRFPLRKCLFLVANKSLLIKDVILLKKSKTTLHQWRTVLKRCYSLKINSIIIIIIIILLQNREGVTNKISKALVAEARSKKLEAGSLRPMVGVGSNVRGLIGTRSEAKG